SPQKLSKNQKAHELPCIFLDLVSNYKDQELNICGMPPNSEHWRNANAPAIAMKLKALQDFILELKDRDLSEFSICVNHYNQVVHADYFYQHLLVSKSCRK
ncbi:5051_t:CDS:2, partial [Gigaspora rosea]